MHRPVRYVLHCRHTLDCARVLRAVKAPEVARVVAAAVVCRGADAVLHERGVAKHIQEIPTLLGKEVCEGDGPTLPFSKEATLPVDVGVGASHSKLSPAGIAARALRAVPGAVRVRV